MVPNVLVPEQTRSVHVTTSHYNNPVSSYTAPDTADPVHSQDGDRLTLLRTATEHVESMAKLPAYFPALHVQDDRDEFPAAPMELHGWSTDDEDARQDDNNVTHFDPEAERLYCSIGLLLWLSLIHI